MKKFLHVIMFVLLSITALQITSVQAADDIPKVDYGSVEFGKELSVESDYQGQEGTITVTAPKDGLYSIRLKRIVDEDTHQNRKFSLGNVYKNDEKLELYTRDYRWNDDTMIDYYQLKKDDKIVIKFSSKVAAKGKIIVDTVDEIKPGQKINFKGEFDKSYYAYTYVDPIPGRKFGCLIPKDEDGNNLLNIRVRDFQQDTPDYDRGDYSDIEDVCVNTALEYMDKGDKPRIFNVYSYKDVNATGDVTKAESEVQFIEMKRKMDSDDSTIRVNMQDDPLAFVNGQDCWKETDANGESYNRYYYSIFNFIKTYTIPFVDGDKEFPVNASAKEEKDPYSPYTGYYLKTWDDQKNNHWTVGGENNCFYVKLAGKTIKVPVELKSSEDIPQLKLNGTTSYALIPNAAMTRKTMTFTPEEDGKYSLFFYTDSHLESCKDTIGVRITDEDGTIIYDTDYSDITSKLDDGRNQYEHKIHQELEGGKRYTIQLFMQHKDENQAGTDTIINLSLSMKNPVAIQSIKVKNPIRPDLIDGIDNVTGIYKYSLGDYIDQLEVTYQDNKVISYIYDSTQNTFVPKEKVDPKYTVYPLIIEDEQEKYPWNANEQSYYSAYIKAKYSDGEKRYWKSCEFVFNVVNRENFQKNYLSEMKIDQPYVFGTVSTEQYLANGSYSKYYQFIPETSGKYNFDTSVTKHDDQCNVTAEYMIYQDGHKVSSDQRLEAGKEYIIKFYGRHSDACQNTDLTSLKPAIKVTKAASDQEPTTATTEVTTATTEATTVTATEKPTTETTEAPTTTTAKATEEPATKPETPSKDTSDKTSSAAANQATTVSNKKDNTTKLAAPTIKQPNGSKIKKVKVAKKTLTITWTKVKDIKGYEIWLSTDKKFKKNRKIVLVGNPKTTKKTVKKLKAKKRYYVRIRTYKKVGFKKVYSKWLNVKSAKTK